LQPNTQPLMQKRYSPVVGIKQQRKITVKRKISLF
jgi:hypothetical protein